MSSTLLRGVAAIAVMRPERSSLATFHSRKREMEKPGGDSRWNTLRALRVLRARTR